MTAPSCKTCKLLADRARWHRASTLARNGLDRLETRLARTAATLEGIREEAMAMGRGEGTR